MTSETKGRIIPPQGGASSAPPAKVATVPRVVADRLAEALQRCRSSLEFEGNYTTAEIARNALAEYRKAVNP